MPARVRDGKISIIGADEDIFNKLKDGTVTLRVRRKDIKSLEHHQSGDEAEIMITGHLGDEDEEGFTEIKASRVNVEPVNIAGRAWRSLTEKPKLKLKGTNIMKNQEEDEDDDDEDEV